MTTSRALRGDLRYYFSAFYYVFLSHFRVVSTHFLRALLLTGMFDIPSRHFHGASVPLEPLQCRY